MYFNRFVLLPLAALLTWCSPSGSIAQQPDSLAGIRIVSVHPWTPNADIYISADGGQDSLLMEDLGYLDATQMHRAPEQLYDMTATVANDPTIPLTGGSISAFAGYEKTVFALAPAPLDIHLLPLLRETGMNIPAGRAMIRILQGSSIPGAASIHIIDSSGASGHFLEMEFADTVDYREMAPGGFTVLVVDDDGIRFQGRATIAAGTAATLIISNDASEQLTYASLLIDTDTGRQEPMLRLESLSSVPEPPRQGAARLSVAPNPMNDRALVPFHLPISGHIQVLLHDGAGRLVATLADEFMEAGDHAHALPAGELPAGVYLLRVLREGKDVIGEATVNVVR